ncbi:MAG TPA: NAD(P)-binding domain-containing protein, partial [Acidimicrobiia bacterium]|nr:NAD(P)-binding domain-containing protein [Acidimicrobiia bacterium]
MDIGMIGLGKMGGKMAVRLVRRGHRVVGFDPDADAASQAVSEGVAAATTTDELV